VLGGATLVVCLITFFVVRAIVRKPPPPPPETVAQQTTTIPEVVANPNKDVIDQHLLAARDAFERREFDTAITETTAVLELEPANVEAADLKRQAEEGKAASAVTATTTTPKPTVPKEPQVTEVSGIPKRTTETQADYDARVLRIKTNYPDGIRLADRQDYVGALAKFELVKRDQPGYSEIDTVISETQAKQHKAVEDAVAQGQKSEQETKYGEARRWYERARGYDPNSASARERLSALQEKTAKAGMDAYKEADVYRKRNLNARALELYKVAVDLLPNGPERSDAQQWLEKLKP
jgi:tetratricopeptide (TPR) repeat protein